MVLSSLIFQFFPLRTKKRGKTSCRRFSRGRNRVHLLFLLRHFAIFLHVQKNKAPQSFWSLEQSARLPAELFGAPRDPWGLHLLRASPKMWATSGPCCGVCLSVLCVRAAVHRCWGIGEGRAKISPASWLSQNPQLSKGEVVHAFDPCCCYHLFTDQHFKPYLWLAGHASGLSEPGYSPCGFLMIYLDKICGMREMKLSALLCGTSVHVRKWKYFQKRWHYFDWWHKLLRQHMSLKSKKKKNAEYL